MGRDSLDARAMAGVDDWVWDLVWSKSGLGSRGGLTGDLDYQFNQLSRNQTRACRLE
jgi:hypothetical protein